MVAVFFDTHIVNADGSGFVLAIRGGATRIGRRMARASPTRASGLGSTAAAGDRLGGWLECRGIRARQFRSVEPVAVKPTLSGVSGRMWLGQRPQALGRLRRSEASKE